MVASFYIMLYLRNIPFSIPCDKMGDIRGRGREAKGEGKGKGARGKEDGEGRRRKRKEQKMQILLGRVYLEISLSIRKMGLGRVEVGEEREGSCCMPAL